jgi:hypothetical protein
MEIGQGPIGAVPQKVYKKKTSLICKIWGRLGGQYQDHHLSPSSGIPKTEAEISTETSVTIYQITPCHKRRRISRLFNRITVVLTCC